MEPIIALCAVIGPLLTGVLKVNFGDLLDEWSAGPTRRTLWKWYGFAALMVLILNLFVLLARAVVKEGGGSFLPTYLNRTPLEWFMGAFSASFVLFLCACFVIKDQYLIAHGQLKPGIMEVFKRWKWFYLIDMTFGVVGYSYQVYWYGWWPW